MYQATEPTAPTAAATTAAGWEPRIVAIICNWCTYAGADMAGTTRRAYPANVRPVRVPCTGRIDPQLIIKAFEQGADAVVISGCHPGDCHYVQGNYVARRRFTALRSLMNFLGLDERRLQFAWVSASEGLKWSSLVAQVTSAVREVGPLRDWGKPSDRSLPKLPAVPAAPRTPAGEADAKGITTQLQQLVGPLLADGTLSVAVGYAAGSLPGQMVPRFVTSAEEVLDLGWSDRCVNNLARYIPEARRQWGAKGKIGVVVKPCDARSVVGYVQENQLKREDVVVIGVDCAGVSERGGLALKCYACDGEVPAGCDYTVTASQVHKGAVAPAAKRPVAADPRDALCAFVETMPNEERWAYWQTQFDHCLRCYACRGICPLCYCGTCIAEKNRPQWVPTSIDAKGNLTWNLTRALHLAGRCIGCDECARVCPADIRLDLVNHRIAMEIQQRFGYRSGQDASVSPPLSTFRPDDAQEFIR